MAGCVCERMPHYSLGTKILRGPPMLITLPLVIVAPCSQQCWRGTDIQQATGS